MTSKSKNPKSSTSTTPVSIDNIKTTDAKINKEIAGFSGLSETGETSLTDPNLQKKVNALKNIQLDMIKIEAKFFDDLHELECKYAKMYEPYYEKRKQIVIGDYQPTDAECRWALDEESDEKDKVEPKKITEPLSIQAESESNAKSEKGITNFWLDTLQSFRITAEIIQEADEPILSYLQDIRVNLFDKIPYGYTLEFHFAENPYFTNKVLTKTYELTTEIPSEDPFSFEGPDLSKSIGCKINWKDGKNVTVKLIKKKIEI